MLDLGGEDCFSALDESELRFSSGLRGGGADGPEDGGELFDPILAVGLKTRSFNRLKAHGKNWIEELPSVLWSIRTTATKPTGETPFALVYGAEAVLPTEIKQIGRASCRERVYVLV